jgi:predicted lipoprotein
MRPLRGELARQLLWPYRDKLGGLFAEAEDTVLNALESYTLSREQRVRELIAKWREPDRINKFFGDPSPRAKYADELEAALERGVSGTTSPAKDGEAT